MLNMAFGVALSETFVKYIEILRFLRYKDYKNILLFHSLCVLICPFFKPNCSPSWILNLYQIHTFNNNLNDKEKITSHLMRELHYKTTFVQ